MASLFQSTMVSMVYHGILPWFTCFKTPWHLPWYIFTKHHGIYHGIFSQNTMAFIMVYFHNSMGRGHLVLLT